MVKTVRSKKAIAIVVVEVFIREGRVLDPKEWMKLKDKPFTVATLRSYLGSWNRMLARVKTSEPEKWALIGTDEGKEYKPNKKVDSTKVKPEKWALAKSLKKQAPVDKGTEKQDE